MMPAMSEPALGSENSWQNSSSPASMRGTCLARNSGDPCLISVLPTGP